MDLTPAKTKTANHLFTVFPVASVEASGTNVAAGQCRQVPETLSGVYKRRLQIILSIPALVERMEMNGPLDLADIERFPRTLRNSASRFRSDFALAIIQLEL